MKKRIKRFFKRLKLKTYLYFKNIGFAPTHQDDPATYEKTCFLILLSAQQPSVSYLDYNSAEDATQMFSLIFFGY
jgi:hypothetical protein